MKLANGLTAAVIAVAALAGSTSAAEDTLGGWKFTVAPYVWLFESERKVTVGDRSAKQSVDFDDVFDLMGDGDLFGGAGHFEGRYEDRFTVFFDVVGVQVDPGRTGRAGFEREIDSALFFLETGGAIQIWKQELGEHASMAFEPLVGMRWVYTWNQLTIETPGTIGESEEFDEDVDEDFIEPLLGGRFLLEITPELSFVFRGDAGGFGAGSDLSYQLLGTLLYRLPWKPGRVTMDAAGGYRLLDFDWEEGRRELELEFYGPTMGLVVHF